MERRESYTKKPFDDPFVGNLLLVVKELHEISSAGDLFARHEELAELKRKLSPNLNDVFPLKTMTYAHKNFDKIEPLLDRLASVYEFNQASTELPAVKAICDTQLELIPYVKRFHPTLSPTHAKLQRHFFDFRTQVTRVREHVFAINQFFAPLYRLRDEYFYNPSNSSLRAYLRECDLILSNPYYEIVVLQGVDLKIHEERMATARECLEELREEAKQKAD